MNLLLPGLNSAPNLHPVVVHFPVVFWVTANAIWIVAAARRNDELWRAGLWLHTAGLVGAVFAVALGFVATAQTGHDSPGHDLVHTHRDIMLAATALSSLVVGIGWWRRGGTAGWRWALVVASLLQLGVTIVGADRGAELVFRYGVGVANESPPETEDEHHHDSQPNPEPVTGGHRRVH
jgi:uncharacterized membrane protein